MFIVTRTTIIEAGNSEEVLKRFSEDKPVDGMEGLIDRIVMVNTKSKEHEEVVMIIRWESKEAWKNWEKSDVHIQGHRENRGQQPPAYIISTDVKTYDVHAVKKGKASN
ncbi:antibiotic biosynthesis monooxygenase [Paenibacillus antibioticophila]|uniref:antibiotic biosynthesis monooxygenase n=1 Tax=Paenibacillus antibioticophila TaxID=1274374 RepID=UPI0005CA09C3|nr:antibiotic biosynthesis monooxygenase [Paenibacillus antibioticophila]